MDNNLYVLCLSDGQTVNISIKKKKIRSYYISVSPDLEVSVSVPLHFDQETLNKFIESHKNWVAKKLLKFSKLKKESFKENLSDGGCLSVLGTKYIVFINESSDEKIIVDGFGLNIFTKKPQDIQYIKKQLIKYLKKEAEAYFDSRINYFMPVFIKYGINEKPDVKIKILTGKWGSCMPRKRAITLNLHLYKTPVRCVDYVIFHELTHLLYYGHQKNFYNFITKYFPDYKELDAVLKQEAVNLFY